MIRTASAAWTGSLKNGGGNISTQRGMLDRAQYGFSTRFADDAGTNPEELIAAAHAGCFTMALAAQLGMAGMTAESLKTNAAVTMEKLDDGVVITSVHLDLLAIIPGADQTRFEAAAQQAKLNCPISKLLKATITLDAILEN